MNLRAYSKHGDGIAKWLCAALIVVGGFVPLLGQSVSTPGSSPSSQAAQTDQMSNGSLPAVHLDGNYFSHGGKQFIPVGVNWVPAKAAMEWPYQWDPASIEADFAQMHQLGVNTVRLDLVWAWFEPRPDVYNPEAFRQLHFISSLANKYQIYLNPELLIGGEVGEAYWDVAYRQGRNPQSDPYMLRLETDYAGEMGRQFAKDNAILAWDLTDEPPFWIVQDTVTDSMAINWTRLISGAIRRYDTSHPLVVGTSGEEWNHGPFRPDNLRGEMDFFSVHPYETYLGGLLSLRQTYGAAFETALSAGAGRPVMLQELGASSAQYDPDVVAKYEQTSMYSSLGTGANGFLIWCYTDAAPEQYSKVPYLRSPNETRFGIVTWDRKERPAAKMLTEFSKTVGQMNLEGVEPAPAKAAILVPNEWSKPYGDQSHFGLTGPNIVPYTSTDEGGADGTEPSPHNPENSKLEGAWLSSFILARQAGLKTEFPREYSDWQKYAMLILPSPLTGTETWLTHLHSDFWGKARTYVESGGALYASVSGDAAIPEMDGLFGARLLDTLPVRDVTLKVVAPFGNLKPGDTFKFSASPDDRSQWTATLKVNGGQVIAVDQDGRPALVAHQLGRGKTLLSAYPIEIYLAKQPSAFEYGDQAYRIYGAFREWAGVKPLVWTSAPTMVEASCLNAHGHGYIVVVNHSSEQQHVSLGSSLPIQSLKRVTLGGAKPVNSQNSGWNLDLPPYGGAILAWD